MKENKNEVQLLVHTTTSQEELRIDRDATLLELRQVLHERFREIIPPAEDQKVVFVGKVLPEDEDQSFRLSSLISEAGAEVMNVVVLQRRSCSSSDVATIDYDGNGEDKIEELSESMINKALEEDRQLSLAAGETVPEAPLRDSDSRSSSEPLEAVETSLRALVQGNFEQLRNYMEQIQSSMARHRMVGGTHGSGFDIDFGGSESDDEDDENAVESSPPQDTGGRSESVAEDNIALDDSITPIPDPIALHEMTSMGFDDALSRNALLLHRNRLPLAIEWALEHAEDPEARQTLDSRIVQAIFTVPGGIHDETRILGLGNTDSSSEIQADPEQLETMINMGFSNDVALFALQMTGNRLEDACQFAASFVNFFGDANSDSGDNRNREVSDDSHSDIDSNDQSYHPPLSSGRSHDTEDSCGDEEAYASSGSHSLNWSSANDENVSGSPQLGHYSPDENNTARPSGSLLDMNDTSGREFRRELPSEYEEEEEFTHTDEESSSDEYDENTSVSEWSDSGDRKLQKYLHGSSEEDDDDYDPLWEA